MSPMVLEAFYLEGDADRSVSFGTLNDPHGLMKQLRREHGMFGNGDAEPVVVITHPDGDEPGTHLGSVSVVTDGNHLVSVDRAIRCLQAVRAGMLDPGHAQDC